MHHSTSMMVIAKLIIVMFVLLWSANEFLLTSEAAADKQMCKDKEREALLSLKQALTNVYYYGSLSSWGSSNHNMDCCYWQGVKCSATTGHVIKLELYGLSGEISLALLELHHLNSLVLSENDFGANKIPEFICSLENLEHLDLSLSNFSGDVPYQLGNLTNLTELDLSYNSLTSKDLTWLSNLTLLSDLRLSHNQFDRPLSWLSNLTLLSYLDLSDNQFEGLFPDLKAFSSLEGLTLRKNKLSGQLPVSIGQFSNLEILDVSSNYLEGTISEVHLSKLHNLTVLDLSLNSLALNFSLDWTPPFNLQSIMLRGCNLGARFPMWLQTQDNYYHLDISFAGISDEAPIWFWNLSPHIQYLNLSYNQISGSIPDLSSNVNSYIVDISSNKFSGPVPLFPPASYVIQLSSNMFTGSIGSLCRVEYYFLLVLDLSKNELSGKIPSCWESMTELQVFNLADNKFSGTLPHSLGSLTRLRTLQFHNNNLTGNLPSTLKNCIDLQLIDGAGNGLTGNVPAWMGMFMNLTFLRLHQNHFGGSIPLEICRLKWIQVLDLSENNFSGTIPPCFNNFTSLQRTNTTALPIDVELVNLVNSYAQESYVNEAIVKWKRQDSVYKRTVLGLLKLIDLSSNNFVGNIPRQFSLFSGLVSLNLSRNSLTGDINPDINRMKVLETLDLSRNNLSGVIPTGLAELYNLAVLDLSNNNLSGEIPKSTQLQTFDPSAYGGNNKLCGDPLPKCSGDDPINPGTIEEPKGEGFNFIQSLVEEYFISVILGFIVGFWGLVGPLVMKRSWRDAYYGFLSNIGNWLYLTVTLRTRRLIRYMKSRK